MRFAAVFVSLLLKLSRVAVPRMRVKFASPVAARVSFASSGAAAAGEGP